jgi:hypothetical protein
MLRLLRAAGVLAAVFLFASESAAQDREQDAERLFREGQKLLEEHRYGEACPKFEAAYRKDGQLGTLLNLAFCHKEQGANWYAWLEFREAEVKAAEQKRNERQEFARKALDGLEKSLPKVILDGAQSHALTEVLVEDRRVPEAERGSYFTAEEGKRKFTFRAKGKKTATTLVNVGPKTEKMQHIAVPELEDAPVEPVTPPPPPPQPDHPEPKPPKEDDYGSTQRIVGWTVLGAGGAIGIGLGTFFGIQTLNSPCVKASSESCTHEFPKRADQMNENDKASTSATLSTISFIAGGAAIVTGIALVLTAPKASREASIVPWVGPASAGVRGTF